MGIKFLIHQSTSSQSFERLLYTHMSIAGYLVEQRCVFHWIITIVMDPMWETQLISGSVVDRGISALYCLPPETQDCSQSASALPLWEEARAKCGR